MTNQEQTTKYDISLWKDLLPFFKHYKKTFIQLIFCMLGLAVIDASFPLMTRYAIDHFIQKNTTEHFLLFGILYFAMVLMICTIIYLFIRVAGVIESGVGYTLRKECFNKLQELSFSYYDQNAVGWLMSRVTSDSNRIAEIVSWGLVDFTWGAAMMSAITVVMFMTSWKLALITLAVIPLLVLISMYFQKIILQASRDIRKTNSAITGALNEGILGARTTKTLVRELDNEKDFEVFTSKMKDQTIRSSVLSAVYLPIVLSLSSIGMALALYTGGIQISQNMLTVGTLILFINYAILFYEPVREMARIFAELQMAQASAERILTMLHTPLEIQDAESVIALYGDAFVGKPENWERLSGHVTFENVSFHYTENEPIFENLNLTIPAGQTIALVGETGSGKSSLVNLACRFYEPKSGRILIDGKDYRERSQLWLHSNIGYVLQTPHLFSGTIRDNIRYGKLDATDEEILEASKLANAYTLIEKQDKGLDTEVGEGGSMLSTGEKQLISFARAILSNPRLFVLDEATSSIDTETEMQIQDAIQNILKGRTSFIVAHRLSTIRHADRILVLDKGNIIEDGNHDTLMADKAHYYKLYTNQFIDETEMALLKTNG
jgi:ATP-binding cassette subfamily B protein